MSGEVSHLQQMVYACRRMMLHRLRDIIRESDAPENKKLWAYKAVDELDMQVCQPGPGEPGYNELAGEPFGQW